MDILSGSLQMNIFEVLTFSNTKTDCTYRYCSTVIGNRTVEQNVPALCDYNNVIYYSGYSTAVD
jgi:hypothetical protein